MLSRARCSLLTWTKLYTTYVRRTMKYVGPMWSADLECYINALWRVFKSVQLECYTAQSDRDMKRDIN